MSTVARPTQPRARWVFLLTFAALWVSAVAWALALPPGASPDETDHFIRAAAVARGQVLGEPGAEPWLREVQVPQGIARSREWLCYSGDSWVDASCAPQLERGEPDYPAHTSAGLYNPVFYALVGIPTLLDTDPQTALYLSRALSAAWCAAMLAIGFTFVRASSNVAVAGTISFAAITPMVLFLAGTLNPSGMEIAAAFALISGLYYVAKQVATPSWLALGAVVTAATLLASVRGLGPVWLALAGLAWLTMLPRGRLRELLTIRRVQVAVAAVGVAGVSAVGWTLATGTLGAMGLYPGHDETGPLLAFVVMLTRTIAPGLVGHFAWHDVLAPSYAYFAYALVMGLVVVLALWLGTKVQLKPVWIIATGWLLLPPLAQAIAITDSGYIWQARYSLPGLVMLVVVCGAVVANHLQQHPGTSRTLMRRAAPTLVGIALVAHVGSFVTVQRRFGVGMGGELDGAYTEPLWVPPGGSVLWLALFTVAMTGWAAWVAWPRADSAG